MILKQQMLCLTTLPDPYGNWLFYLLGEVKEEVSLAVSFVWIGGGVVSSPPL